MFTVAGYTGSSPLSGFPVLVSISTSSPAGFAYTDLHSQSDGADLCFIDMNGNGLPFEIDTWNPNGTSLVWVRLPTMTNGTQFVMCWGSDSSGRAVCAAKPWADYTGVWHMGETGTPSSSNPVTIHDSTANGLDGSTPVGEAASGSMVGGAWRISSDSDHAPSIRVALGSDSAKKGVADALGTDFHASFWMRAKGVVQWANLICRRKGDQGTGWGFSFHENSGNAPKLMRVYAGSTTPATSSDTYNLGATLSATDNAWKKLDVIWKYAANGNVQVADIYLNGAYLETVTCTETVSQQDTDIGIGCSTQDAYDPNDKSKKGRRVNAEMDEVRLGAFVPSAEWIAADYATQTTPGSFLTAGVATPYGATSAPQIGLSISDIQYTNATFVAAVGSLGGNAEITADASWVDATLVVATDDSLVSPLFVVQLDRVSTAPTSVSKFLSGLIPNTTYYAQIRAVNSFDVVGESTVVSFATLAPGPVFSASVITEHIAPEISLSFANSGFGSVVTQIVVDVSSTGDFTSPDLTRIFSVNLDAMPTAVNDIALTGLPTSSPLYYQFTAVNSDGYATTVAAEAANPVGDGNNVWSGLSENIDDADAYIFAGGLPEPDKTLYFTTPAGLSPVINRDVAMPSLRFWNGNKDNNGNEVVDPACLGGYHSCGYDLSGSGILSFTAEKPILQASKGTNIVRNPLVFNRTNSQTVYITGRSGRLDLTGELMLPDGVTNTTMRVNGEGGEVHFGGPSPDFMGRLFLESSFTLSLDVPNAMTNVNRIYFEGGWGSFTYLKNNTGAPMTFPRCTMVDNTTGWSNTRASYDGAPFLFPAATFRHYDRGGNGTKEADVFAKNLVVLNAGTWFNKYGNGTFAVVDETAWESNTVKHGIALYGGCFWAQTDAGLPPTGEFYVPNDHVWQATIGLSQDSYPTLDGSATPRVFQSNKLANWGFTGFGGERTVCWNADPTLNLTNTSSGTVAIPLGDSAHTNANGKAYSDYYAYPAAFVFGNRSEFADGTILFLNPIRYELGQDWDGKTVFESTNHVVAARLRGSLKLGTSGKTWNFSGRNFGGYLALEADNSDFTGKVNVHEKGNLLVNSNLVARSVTVQADSGLGGTGSLGTVDGTTVKSGGSLFGGEWNKGGTLTLNGKVTLEGGSVIRAEVGASNDTIGLIKLAPGSTFSLTAPVHVDVDTDPRVSPDRGVSRKVLDWSEASLDSVPTRADFVERPERNSDLRRIRISIREDGLYVSYITVRSPFATIMTLR